jgi:hypothetical protein
LDSVKRTPSKIQLDILGPDLLLPEGASFDSLLKIDNPVIDENLIKNEIDFDYKVTDKSLHLQKELESAPDCGPIFRKRASEALEEFIIKKMASREEILNMDLLMRLYEQISSPNENYNNLLLPSMQVNEDPFYYYAVTNVLTTIQPNNDFFTKLISLGENAKQTYEKRLNAQLEDCIDVFDVFIMLNKLAIEHPGKMHLVKSFIYEFCERKGFKMLGIDESFSFGMGCDFSGRLYPFEPIPDNIIPRFTFPAPSE